MRCLDFPIDPRAALGHNFPMTRLILSLSFAAVIASLTSCTSNSAGGSGDGGTYYAPSPQNSVDQTVRMQDQMGGMVRSGIR